MTQSALIVGATGLVGSHCLQKLLSLNEFQKVKVLVRKPLKLSLPDEKQKKLEEHVINFDELDSSSSLFNVDVVFCCLGTTLKQAGSVEAFKKVDYDYCLKVAELAKAKDVKHFLIITAINASSSSFTYYSKTKGLLQEALINLNFDKLSIFQPSLLLGERDSFRFGEAIFAKASGIMNRFLPSPMNAYKAIPGEVVGHSMAILGSDEKFQKNGKLAYYRYNDMFNLIEQERE